jgi:hypothetical protein
MIGLLLALVLSSPSPCTLSTVGATPTPDAPSVTVVLPAILDPTGCPQELPHGTRVFKVPSLFFMWGGDEWETRPDGTRVLSYVVHLQPVYGYDMKVHYGDDQTVVVDECGNSHTLPGKKYLYEPDGSPGYSFAFFPPSRPPTKEFCKAVADYVVP